KDWLDEHGLPEQEAAEVDIPIEGWDDDDIDLSEAPPEPAGDGLSGMDNPLGFSPEELKEMVMDDDLGHLEPPPEMPREDTLPRAPMLRPTSETSMKPATPGRRDVIRGRAAISL